MVPLALSLWLEWVGLTLAKGLGSLVLLRVALETTSSVLMALFGVSCMAAAFPSRGGDLRRWRWVVAPPVLAAAVSGLWGLEVLQAVVRQGLGFLALALGGIGLFLWSRARISERAPLSLSHSFILLSVGILIVGLVLGTPVAPVWPASWLNAESVRSAIGIPPALIQAVGAVMLAAETVGRLTHHRRRQAERTTEWVPPSRLPSWVLPALVAAVTLGFLLTWLGGARWEGAARTELLQGASLAGIGVSGPVGRLADREVVSVLDPAYVDLKERLSEMQKAVPGARFLSVMRLVDGRVEFVADSVPPESPEARSPGQVYQEAPAALVEALSVAREPFVLGPYSDRWGGWLSGVFQIIGPGSVQIGRARV